MGALKPWHIITLACCLLTVAAVVGGIVFAMMQTRRK